MKKLHLLIIFILAIPISVALFTSCTSQETQGANESSGTLTIYYLTAPVQVMPTRLSEILCVAVDRENSPLTYEWKASGGEIRPEEEPQFIKWFSPEKEGEYEISVTVKNQKGNIASKSVRIKVTREQEQHPKIYAVKCDNCRNQIEASRFTEYTLRCEAVDPNNDPLRYIWFANIGKIKGEGNYATWSPGAQFGNALITVIVIDSDGNESVGYLAINVACCK